MKIAIIGAGPAGLTAGYVLSKKHSGVDVYETSDAVGGLAKSIRLWGQTVDIGPHRFFSSDKRVNELWLEVVGKDYEMVDRLTRILYKNRFFRYPLQPWNALKNLGPIEALRCIASYGMEKLCPTPDVGTFESWVRSRFGERLFNIFFKTYSEKLWGIKCHELDADFAAQRIKKFSLSAAIKSAFSLGSKSEHRTLVDQFAYPIHGTGMVYDRMAQAICDRGGNVFLKSPVRRVLTRGERVTGLELEDGSIRHYDWIISSMPLTLMVTRLAEVPAQILDLCKQLKYRNTIIVYLEVADQNVCADNWMYVHSAELQTGRITNFRNWVPQLCSGQPNTILALEYWCNDGDELWKYSDAQLIDLAKNELLATRLVTSVDKIKRGMAYRIPRSYPVYRRGYKKILKPIESYLNSIQGLQVIGRYGAFKYNNQDHSILMGILAAEKILNQAEHDLWDVNSDYENYQESYRITETGLARDH